MGLILVEFDPTLEKSDIIIPLTYPSKDEAQENYVDNQAEVQQTHIHGIQAPLIMINNIVVNFIDVISFELTCEKITPEVRMVVHDRCNLSTMIDSPSIDNELIIQILPKFEGVYKKINLSFYITQMRNNGGVLHISGEYKLPKFIASNIKSFGEISIYKLFETIATDTKLGFTTNVADDDKKRYIYCDNKSFKDMLRNETALYSDFENGELKIYDYWVDWWDYLTLADIYERYNAVDPDEWLQMSSASQNKEMDEGSEIEPISSVATFNNHPSQKNTELYVENYKINSKAGLQMFNGTDRVFSIYESSKKEYMDYLIQDGDSHNDIFTKYEYVGEVYGEHNYLLASKKHETFKQKILTNENIEITLRTPLLGVMRGNRVNFFWYVNNGFYEDVYDSLKENGVTTENPQTNIPFPDDPNIEENIQDGHFILDKSISGQYLVTKCILKFSDGRWQYNVTLSRPTNTKPQMT